jgi:hypothetical protein
MVASAVFALVGILLGKIVLRSILGLELNGAALCFEILLASGAGHLLPLRSKFVQRFTHTHLRRLSGCLDLLLKDRSRRELRRVRSFALIVGELPLAL